MARDVKPESTPPAVVLVTGGAGFIGCALSPHLLAQGAHVMAIDSLLPQVHPGGQRPEDLPEGVDLTVGDVRDPSIWDSLLDRVHPDLIVHLAAETGTGQSLTESTRHAETNVVGTTVMLDALLRHEALPQHLVLASSRAVYGEGAWIGSNGDIFYPPQRSHRQLEAGQWDHLDKEGGLARPVPGEAALTHPNPSSVYGSTKLAQELIMRNWAMSFDVPLSVFRLQNVYGPGQSPHNPYTGIITLFHRLAARRESLDIYEDGNIGRDFVYIDDVISALVAGISAPPVGVPRLLDVGTGVVTTIDDAARTIADYHGAPLPHVSGKFRDGDVRYAVANAVPLQDALGWQARWTFAQGSASVAKWLAAGGFLD